MTTTDCTTDYGEYERYSDDRLFHGAGLKIDRSVYYKGVTGSCGMGKVGACYQKT